MFLIIEHLKKNSTEIFKIPRPLFLRLQLQLTQEKNKAWESEGFAVKYQSTAQDNIDTLNTPKILLGVLDKKSKCT